jgi:hypothetical protein
VLILELLKIIVYFFLAFESWQDELQERNNCTYITYGRMFEDKLGNKCNNLRCNRSGCYKPNRTGKRKLKSSGKSKYSIIFSGMKKVRIYWDLFINNFPFIYKIHFCVRLIKYRSIKICGATFCRFNSIKK